MTTIQKASALISLGAGAAQVPIIECARQKGYRVIAIDRDETAPGFQAADERLVISTHDAIQVLDVLHALQPRYNFSGIVARTGEQALYTAAAIAREFHLRGLTDELVKIATEKSALRAWGEEYGIRVPHGMKCSSVTPKVTPELRYPLVVKPDATVVGKKGITLIESPVDLPRAIAAASSASANGFIEVEEYVEGIDASCLFIARNGEAQVVTYWDELVDTTNEGSIRGRGASVPTRVSALAQERMANIATVVTSQFPAVQALLICSFRVGPNDYPYLIEMHADLGGDGIADILLPQAIPGLNYFDLAISVACEDGFYISQISLPKPTLMEDGSIVQHI